MNEEELQRTLEFLKGAERLKTVTRSAYTTTGQQESVAEHTWRVTLMAALLGTQVPDVDQLRLIRMCIVHDLGEAIGGDIPAPEQARRKLEGESAGKSANERRDLLRLLEPLSPTLSADILSLWEEYEAARTPTARLAKALDKLETILQHTQGRNPPAFDYRFNLDYGKEHTDAPPLIAELRAIVDRETERLALAAEQEKPAI